MEKKEFEDGEFEKCYKELKKWVEIKDKYILLDIQRDIKSSYFGLALQVWEFILFIYL